MGIKGLSKFLQSKTPWTGSEDLSGKRIAIDVPLYLHKFFYAQGPMNLGFAFHSFRNKLISMGITPVWVFDGGKLHLKDKERERRKMAHTTPREFTLITKPGHHEYQTVQTILSHDTVKIATFEAEALCAYLVATGDCYAAMTNDTDIFAYLCPRVVWNGNVTMQSFAVLSMDTILRDVGLTADEFQHFCVMCGCDFCDNELNVGPVRAYHKAKRGVIANSEIVHLFRTYCYECTSMDDGVSESSEQNTMLSPMESPS
jgi:5'-3' exonuclease